MKAIAILCCLCSCAHAQMETPASLPFVRIDTTMQGMAISRQAAEALAARRSLERAEWEKKLIDEQTKTKSVMTERDAETKRANTNDWWSRNGLGMTFGGTAIGAAIAAIITMAAIGGKK